MNFVLHGDRQLARGWPARARDNIAAITLSKALEDEGRAERLQVARRVAAV